jgi:hypothetical protein
VAYFGKTAWDGATKYGLGPVEQRPTLIYFRSKNEGENAIIMFPQHLGRLAAPRSMEYSFFVAAIIHKTRLVNV